MKYFIFTTAEGYTYQPNSNATIPDAENCQVLGFGEGDDVSKAFENFITENLWLSKTSYDQVIAYELRHKEFSGKLSLRGAY